MPHGQREGGEIWAVMTKDWHDCDASVKSRANADKRQHQLENREINVPEEYHQADEEQEQRNVEKCGQQFDCPWKEKFINTFGKEGANPGTLVWSVTRLSDFDISSCPLLQEGREKSTGKTDHQAQEPESVHPNGIVWWGKWWRGRREGNIRPIRVSYNLIDVRKVEVGGVLRVWSNILNRY